MKNKQLKKVIEKLINESFLDGKIIESRLTQVIKAFKTLPKHKSIFALTEYLKGLKRKERQHTMIVETTFPLSPIQISKCKKIVDKKFKITKVIAKIDPEILGGFRLKIGDEVWDQSLLGKINEIKEVIAHGRPDSSN